MGEELKMVKSMLRSVLMSCKEGVAVDILQKDYREVTGEPLPFRKCGFTTLEQFILSMPDVVRVEKKMGQYICHAVADQSTAHIQKLVSKQRSKKVKKPMRRPRGGGGGARFLSRPGPPYRPPLLMTPPYSPAAGPMPYIPGQGLPPRGQNRRGIPSFINQPSKPFTPIRVHIGSSGPNSRTIRIASPEFKENNGSRFEMPPRFQRQRRTPVAGPHGPTVPFKRKLEQNLSTLENGDVYIEQLANYMQDSGLPIKFETSTAQGGYVSFITIHNHAYGSEDIYKTASEAEAAAARTAMTKLDLEQKGYKLPTVDWNESTMEPSILNWADEVCKEDTPSSLPPEKLELVQQRVKQILANKKNGVWMTRIPHEYKENYKEEPPVDLMSLVKSWPNIAKVENVPNTDRDIVYPVEDSRMKDLPIQRVLLLQRGEEVVTYASYIFNPGYFCLQREDSIIDEISEKLQTHCKSASVPDPRLLEKGQFCAGIYSGDERWTRAEILQINDQGKAELLFLDYGNVEWVEVKSIRWLNEELADYPVQATNCSLCGVVPLEGETAWSASSSKELAQLVEEQALVAKAISVYDELVDVELYLQSNPGESLSDLLVKKGVVRREAGEEEEEEDDGEVVDSVEPGDLVLPEDNQWDVFVTYISSSTASVMLRLVGEEYSDKLDSFQEVLEEAFKNTSSESPIIEGVTYVAYDDNLYHRVRVLSKDDKKVQCYFLDHGDTDVLLPCQLEPLDPRINKLLPYQAVEVCMYGLEEVCTNVTALLKMCDLALGKTCVAEVLDRESIPSVILYDTSGDVDININDMILKTIEEEGGGIDTPKTESPGPASATSTPKRVLSPVPTSNLVTSDKSDTSDKLASDLTLTNSGSSLQNSKSVSQGVETKLTVPSLGNAEGGSSQTRLDSSGDLDVKPKIYSNSIPTAEPVLEKGTSYASGEILSESRAPEVPDLCDRLSSVTVNGAITKKNRERLFPASTLPSPCCWGVFRCPCQFYK